jgi:hypothetical protein
MTGEKVDNKKDILLLLLYSEGVTDSFNESIKGRTRLVKMVFIFWKEALKYFIKGLEIKEENFYKFFAWNFGPFSKEIYDDIIFFQLKGFIYVIPYESDSNDITSQEFEHWINETSLLTEEEESNYSELKLSLTPKGEEYAMRLYKQLDSNQKILLKNFKNKFNTVPLRSILRYVYKTYPEYAENSIIRNNILGENFSL